MKNAQSSQQAELKLDVPVQKHEPGCRPCSIPQNQLKTDHGPKRKLQSCKTARGKQKRENLCGPGLGKVSQLQRRKLFKRHSEDRKVTNSEKLLQSLTVKRNAYPETYRSLNTPARRLHLNDRQTPEHTSPRETQTASNHRERCPAAHVCRRRW